MSQRYTAIFEQADNNWAAYVPDLPGCISTGKTLEETERNIREAIQGHLRTLREFGEPVPPPTKSGQRDRSLSSRIDTPRPVDSCPQNPAQKHQ
jgi:predicted RNase H-like HicB family nuclease